MCQENKHTSLPFPIIYRDAWILAINKPANILSVPAKDSTKENCYRHILQHYPYAKIVHRLDEPTSGILLFALDDYTEKQLHQQFRHQQTQKEYLAIVEGRINAEQGTINAPLSADWPNRPKQKICWQTGKTSCTQWTVIRRDQHSTRLKLTPISGRTHQLRLHLSHINHPIIGDTLYNHSTPNAWNKRLLLHAKSLTFTHPISHSPLQLNTHCPF